MMSTTLSVLSTTGLEIEIEPFILDLSSPCSTTPSTPTTDCSDPNNSTDIRSKTTSEADLFNESNGENLLNFLFSPTEPYLTLFETLAQDPSPAARAALIYYMSFAPLVQRDISALVPSLLHEEEVMNGIAINVGQFYTRGFVSVTEVEYLLMHISVCETPRAQMIMKWITEYWTSTT